MNSDHSAPISLKVVAGLFIFGGLCSAIEVLVSLANGNLNINFGVLGLFIGPGLLRFSPGWRTCALVFLWIALVGVPIVALTLIVYSGPIDFMILGQKVGYSSKELALAMAAALFALSLWQYRVLTRPDIRALFGLGDGQVGMQQGAGVFPELLEGAERHETGAEE